MRKKFRFYYGLQALFVRRLLCLVPWALCLMFYGGQAFAGSPQVCFQKVCYSVDVAQSPEAREQGLMFREKLDPGHGMLFVFDQTDDYAFWMKNMTFPIDILWLDDEKHVVYVAPHVPPCKADPCPIYSPGAKARYVLEIPEGDAKKYGVLAGTRADFNGKP